MSIISVAWWKDLDTWTMAHASTERDIWPQAHVRDVLTPSKVQAYSPGLDEAVRFAGVRWYGGGLFVRETRVGSELTGRCFPLTPGNLVYNRLFAWKSAFALVLEEFDDVKVSGEFPQFGINTERVVPQFIQSLCSSGPFAHQILASSSGSTAVSRNRLREAEFLRLKIPLPPLEDQRRIVAEYASLQSEADTLQAAGATRRINAWRRFEEALGFAAEPSRPQDKLSIVWFADLTRWDAESGQSDAAESGDWPVVSLGTKADIRLGTQLVRRGAAQGAPHPYLRAANIRRGHVDLSDIKQMNVVDSMAAGLNLNEDDLLFVEGNSREEVGRCGMWTGDPENYIYQNSVIRARVTSEDLSPRYACAWFNSRPGRLYFETECDNNNRHIVAYRIGEDCEGPRANTPKVDSRGTGEVLVGRHGPCRPRGEAS